MTLDEFEQYDKMRVALTNLLQAVSESGPLSWAEMCDTRAAYEYEKKIIPLMDRALEALEAAK
jgi:hypothetical protein